MTTFAYFAATDMDCDGPTTSLYRIPVASAPKGETMPETLWAETFGGSHYFGPSDLFQITAQNAQDALWNHSSIFGGDAKWYDHGKFQYATVNGIPQF